MAGFFSITTSGTIHISCFACISLTTDAVSFCSSAFSSMVSCFTFSTTRLLKCSACLYADNALIVPKALLSLLFDHMIFDNTFSNPASSRTALTEDQAFKPVPAVAGKSLIIHALYLVTVG